MQYKDNVLKRIFVTCALSLAACGPRAHIPPRPVVLTGVLPSSDSGAILARTLAPVLYLQRDEWFPLERVVAVLHPSRPIIAYHLLWKDDVHGSWIPFTVPTDEEVVWVRYDSTRAPVALWTYWHGTILHALWPKQQVVVDVQWGKHGSLPGGTIESDLPLTKKLNDFYAFSWLGLPDIWLGNLTRPGPWCFCHGYGRYRDYSRPLALGNRLDAIVRSEDARDILVKVFGKPYSKKTPWPAESSGADPTRAPAPRSVAP